MKFLYIQNEKKSMEESETHKQIERGKERKI